MDTSSGARPTHGASAEASPASRRRMAAMPAAAAHGSTPPAAPDQPASAADEQPDAAAPAVGGAAAGSRFLSPAPNAAEARPAPAAAEATNTPTRGPRLENDQPPPLTLPIKRRSSGLPTQTVNRVFGTDTLKAARIHFPYAGNAAGLTPERIRTVLSWPSTVALAEDESSVKTTDAHDVESLLGKHARH